MFQRIVQLVAVVAVSCLCAPAMAQTVMQLDLPAQPLAVSLRAIGERLDTNILFDPADVQGITAPAVRGRVTARQAVAQLLNGSRLTFKVIDDRTIALVPVGAGSGEAKGKVGAAREAAAGVAGVAGAAGSDAGPAAVDNQNSDKRLKDDLLSEIIVTGSHIRGTSNQINPIIVIDQAHIEQSGYSSTQDLFRALPQNFSSGGVTQDGFLTGNPNSGQNKDSAAGVDLRGLGPSSTLVLLNGHRLAPSAFGTFVDVSQIPLAAIDRVEVLTDGSSAIYGSDAVAGVVNIILKKDYQGADSSIRYGATTSGGRDEALATQTVGSNWQGGNAVGTVQFERQNALPAENRDFAAGLSSPNYLLPQTRSYSGTFDARQTLFDGLELYADMLLAKRESTLLQSFPEPGVGTYLDGLRGNSTTIDFTPGLRYELSSRWSIDLNGLFGYQKSLDNNGFGVPSQSLTEDTNDNRFTERSLDLVVNGRVGATPAGDIGVAFGASYRTEHLHTSEVETPGGTAEILNGRNVKAAFTEIHVPLVGAANQVFMVEALELSAAVRRDHYSDFGGTTNPHFGVRWSPWNDVSLRASYGTSFRAPSAYEESQAAPDLQSLYNYEVASPSGNDVVPILVATGGKVLSAERAHTLNFGVDYRPAYLGGLDVALDFYAIRFEDRIITPPVPYTLLQQQQVFGSLITPVASDAAAQAIVNAAAAAGAPFVDYYGTGVTGVRYLYDSRTQNAAVVRQSGIDFTSKYSHEFGAHAFSSQLNVSFIDKIETEFSQGALPDNLVNTFGSPPRWRARLDASWGGKEGSLSGAVNTVGSYINTSALGNAAVSSWTTLDLNATLNAEAFLQSAGWRGVSLSLVVLNVLNRDPPYALNGNAQNPVNYDPTNANPLGRTVAVVLRKKW